jgi:hypothetical protein
VWRVGAGRGMVAGGARFYVSERAVMVMMCRGTNWNRIEYCYGLLRESMLSIYCFGSPVEAWRDWTVGWAWVYVFIYNYLT